MARGAHADPPLPHGVQIALERVDRIEVGLEGAWTQTAVVFWTRDDGLLGFESVPRDPARRTVLELVFPGGWLGVHCSVSDGHGYRFDAPRAHSIVEAVEMAAPR